MHRASESDASVGGGSLSPRKADKKERDAVHAVQLFGSVAVSRTFMRLGFKFSIVGLTNSTSLGILSFN